MQSHSFISARRLAYSLMILTFFFSGRLEAASEKEWTPSITLTPPSPFTQNIRVDLRSALYNPSDATQTFHWSFSAASPNRTDHIQQGKTVVAPRSWEGVKVPWKPKGYESAHHIVFSATNGSQSYAASQSIEIVSSTVRSTQQIDGAWMGFYHWSETEGKLWNRDIRTLTDDQWKELVRGMHEIGMNIIVIQETFRNQVYYNKHDIPENGYHGRAFYPSHLYPGRMDIAARDPVEAVLSQADALNMHVFMGVGLYAWFDFSADSLRWHCEVADELWQKYGHHPSFYGWYISEETPGFIHVSANDSPQEIAQYQKEIIEFFQQFRTHVHRFAPHKPIMLATNCHFVTQTEAAWRQLVRCCDIVCPFGFHRMPQGDVTGEDAAAWLQNICDEEGGHLWMDMEVFLFGSQGELYPRPIKGLIDDLLRFPIFEKILCYQFPGLMNAPESSVHPGGRATVQLYEEYKKFYKTKRNSLGLKRGGE
ncbi:MAG: DUF4434 domain-containing protein [Candidatus Omnitrophica bacterium]|nr:DUF4434 domain-containing protein [Candidatus Omnitrophota bacterium]